MGRKPNPLVLTYFDRGAKLEDSSNRYQYTCKSCSEHFPKGRMDSLVAHLTDRDRRCRNLSGEDSNRIDDLLRSQKDQKAQRDQLHQAAVGDLVHQDLGEPQAGGLSDGRSLTGLEALAEASRQVERPGDADAVDGGDNLSNSVIDPSLHQYTYEQQLHNAIGNTHFPQNNNRSCLTLHSRVYRIYCQWDFTGSLKHSRFCHRS